MKDSINYTGFSNTLVISRKRKADSQKGTHAIDESQLADDDPSRHCPPYLMQQATTRSVFKK